MTDTHDTPSETAPRFRACDAYYHANAKGTGSAVKLELHPAHDSTPGSVFVTLAAQLTVGGPQNGAHVFPTFDWKGALKLKLDRADLSQILQVLRGVQESARDGRGLFHRSATGSALIRFEHQIEPRPGYLLSVRKKSPSGEQRDGYFRFDADEAFALALVLERALLYVCFGIPEVRARPAPPPAAAAL